MSETKRPRGRPPKYPADEVRQRLIEAAVARLRVSGVESGVDAVTLDGAIIDADVPRGMSYKIWRVDTNTPQDAFRRATVLSLLSIPAVAGLPNTQEFAAAKIAEAAAELGSEDTEVRHNAISELIRVVGDFNHYALAESADWRLFTALRAAAITRPGADPEVMKALKDGEKFLITEYSKFYAEVASTVGLQLRDGYEMDEFSSAAYSLNEGLALRIDPDFRASSVSKPVDGDDGSWSLFALSLEALVAKFFDWG